MELLFEIFGEEIPARMQQDAAVKLAEAFKTKFKEYSAENISTESWVTPRRLGFVVTGLPKEISAKSEEVRGPKISAPPAAIEGFLAKHNVPKEQLTIAGEYYYLTVTSEASDVSSLIKTIIEEQLKTFVWPKSMRWGREEIRWVRPFHSMVCILEGKVIPIKFGNIIAGSKTAGHRFMSPEQFEVKSYADYKDKLASAKVIIFHTERQQIIRDKSKEIAATKGLEVIEDQALIEEIAGLVEYPVVLLGEIDTKFMGLPREVLVITLRHHQRYMMLEQKVQVALAPYYFIVSNLNASDGGKEIVEGNAKVLQARLSDASFFYEQDKQHTLQSRIHELKKLTFHKDIGTVFDKMQSVLKVALKIAGMLNVDEVKVKQAVELSKTDLVTNMVKEFPELQGVMGYYYAKNDGVDEEIALAIKDQYKPQGPSDSVPMNVLGAIIAIAEKLDTLSQMFAVGIKPTGSKDPYALRRAAIGALRIIDEQHLNIDIDKLGLSSDVLSFINSKL